MKPFFAILVGAALALSACSNNGPDTPAASPAPAAGGYQDQTWELELVNGELFSARPVRATVEFSGSSYRFAGACNTESGSYSLGAGGALALNSGGRTEIGCDDPTDAAFFALVERATQLQVTRAGLSLVTADGRNLAFRPYP